MTTLRKEVRSRRHSGAAKVVSTIMCVLAVTVPGWAMDLKLQGETRVVIPLKEAGDLYDTSLGIGGGAQWSMYSRDHFMIGFRTEVFRTNLKSRSELSGGQTAGR